METGAIERTCNGYQGVTIFYNLMGKIQPDKPTLVFLHGMGGCLTAWDRVRRQLALQGFSSIAIDLRGMGYSGRPTESSKYTIEACAEDVIALIKTEKLKKPLLVGHCLGGMVALTVASRYPDLYGLLLFNATDQYPAVIRPLNPLISLLSRFVGAISTFDRSKNRPDQTRYYHSTDLSPKRILSDIRHSSLRSYFYMFANAATFDGTKLATNITCPTAIVSGTDDIIFPTSLVQKFAERIAHAQFIVLSGVNHVLLYNPTKEKEIITLIGKFTKHLHV